MAKSALSFFLLYIQAPAWDRYSTWMLNGGDIPDTPVLQNVQKLFLPLTHFQPEFGWSYRTGCPVRCMLDRDEDMLISGGRHPFLGQYKVCGNNVLLWPWEHYVSCIQCVCNVQNYSPILSGVSSDGWQILQSSTIIPRLMAWKPRRFYISISAPWAPRQLTRTDPINFIVVV